MSRAGLEPARRPLASIVVVAVRLLMWYRDGCWSEATETDVVRWWTIHVDERAKRCDDLQMQVQLD